MNTRQRIVPFLWFDKEAGEAARLYASVIRDSRIKDSSTIENTPSGTVEIVTAELAGQEFRLMSAGPFFGFTPSVSFLVACRAREEVDALWARLSEKGTVMMELGEYPFSERYGWIQDRYGLSWQLMYMGGQEIGQAITPTLMFSGDNAGKAEEAIALYTSVFGHAAVGDVVRYEEGEEPDTPGTLKHASFTLEGQVFAAMDSARVHGFTFTEAISFEVSCETQAEIDHLWNSLSADPAAEQCGWLKDRYGVSWQIVPAVLAKMLKDPDAGKVARVREAFLKMKKFDVEGLRRAYQGG